MAMLYNYRLVKVVKELLHELDQQIVLFVCGYCAMLCVGIFPCQYYNQEDKISLMKTNNIKLLIKFKVNNLKIDILTT